jgi:hypothetical protein
MSEYLYSANGDCDGIVTATRNQFRWSSETESVGVCMAATTAAANSDTKPTRRLLAGVVPIVANTVVDSPITNRVLPR